jgi:putative hydrolase of HD superfamily
MAERVEAYQAQIPDGPFASPRLRDQLAFLREIDRIKGIFRLTYLLDASRRENDAEHSWELAMMALVLAEYGPEGLDVPTVLTMVLLHDVVEIDAGDVSVYDTEARKAKANLERECAKRVFGLLPGDQGRAMRELWEQFEGRATPEARFAKALDRLQPLLHNYLTAGKAWREHGTDIRDVLRVNQPAIRGASKKLWSLAEALIRDAARRGFLAGDPEASAGD